MNMKAAVFYGEEDIRIEDRPLPEIKRDEVLIRVHACGVCGTDVHIYHGDEGVGKTPAGTVLGHEFAGEIAAVGENVTGWNVGDHVAVDPNKLCGVCRPCREGMGHFCEHMTGIGTTVDGGYEEYCAVPVSQLYRLSEKTTYEMGAMVEPLACAMHGMDLCQISTGSTVVIIGCGLIGQFMIQLARLKGAAKIAAIEPVPEKRCNALKLGADLVIDPENENVHDVLNSHGFTNVSNVIECVGKPETVSEAIEIAGKRSTVMIFGLTGPNDEIKLHPFELFKKELTIKGSFVNPYTTQRAIDMIESGKIDVESMVAEKAELSELPAVLASDERRSRGKIIITL